MVMGKCNEAVLKATLEGDDMMAVAIAASQVPAEHAGDKSKSLGLERVKLEGSITSAVQKTLEKQELIDKQYAEFRVKLQNIKIELIEAHGKATKHITALKVGCDTIQEDVKNAGSIQDVKEQRLLLNEVAKKLSTEGCKAWAGSYRAAKLCMEKEERLAAPGPDHDDAVDPKAQVYEELISRAKGLSDGCHGAG